MLNDNVLSLQGYCYNEKANKYFFSNRTKIGLKEHGTISSFFLLFTC
jgi:hypothetical protein